MITLLVLFAILRKLGFISQGNMDSFSPLNFLHALSWLSWSAKAVDWNAGDVPSQQSEPCPILPNNFNNAASRGISDAQK